MRRKERYMKALYYAFSRLDPHESGGQVIGKGYVYVLDLIEEILSVYQLRWDDVTGDLYTRHMIRQPVAVFLSKKPFDDTEQTKITAQLIRFMYSAVDAGVAQKGSPLKVLPKIIAQVGRNFIPTFENKSAQDLVLWHIGPHCHIPLPCTTVKEKVLVREVIADEMETHIGFSMPDGTECAFAPVFPPASVLRPYVRPGVELRPGVALCDIVPRKKYSWSEFETFHPSIQQTILRDVLRLTQYKTKDHVFTPVQMLKHSQQCSVAQGGLVQCMYEVCDQDRPVVLCDEPRLAGLTENIRYDFARNRFSGR